MKTIRVILMFICLAFVITGFCLVLIKSDPTGVTLMILGAVCFLFVATADDKANKRKPVLYDYSAE